MGIVSDVSIAVIGSSLLWEKVYVHCDAIISEQFKNWHFSWAYNFSWTTRLEKFWANNSRGFQNYDEIISLEVIASQKV